MYHHRPHWLQAGIASLLAVVALTACVRSASTAMTPLPSAPPPTPTVAQVTMTLTATESATTTATSEPTAEPLPVASPQAGSVTATPESITVPCAGAPPTRLRVDLYAYVNPDPPLPNNLRSDAGKDNTLMGDIQPGQAMKILDGPKCADGWVWWQVSTLETELVGWTAEGDEQNYWLVPCSSENECGP